MPKIAVIYYSKTGNTRKLAELITEGCRKVPGCQVEMMALPESDLQAAVQADGFAIGSPDYFSYMAGHVKTFYDDALAHKAALTGKPYVAFGTHGGGARVLESLERLSRAVGLSQAAPGIMCQGAPGAADAEPARALGEALAKAAGG